MRYTGDHLDEIAEAYPRAIDGLRKARLNAVFAGQTSLRSEHAQKFMLHGVARRLGNIETCAAGIFAEYPPERTKPLTRSSHQLIDVLLQAFVIHVNALQDNLAWVYVHEFNLASEIDRRHVSLFKKELSARLPEVLRNYLAGTDLKAWHAQYSTKFRDGIAHRIPLYVPPAQMTKEHAAQYNELQEQFSAAIARHDWNQADSIQEQLDGLGLACPYFLEEEAVQPMFLHPQVLCDAMTAVELFEMVMSNWPMRHEAASP